MHRLQDHEDVVVINQDAITQFLSFCDTRKVPKKGLILRAGAAADKLYYLVEGSASVIDSDEDGNEIILAYLNAGDFIGELGLFYRTNARTANIRARSACVLAEIEYSRLHKLFEKELKNEHPQILTAVGLQLAQRLLQTSRRVTRLAFMDVSGRIARTLTELCNEPDAKTHPNGIQLHISRQEIARIVGCKRETVGRVLKSMEEEGLVEAKGMNIVVHERIQQEYPN
ncbi:MAG: cAMP-activated global transcriptional regulator CRP [Gammaproteobacteria bacterium]|nr:cAMP-activated global transcriptional regulator CRP [Gammaproteobacteria bacterium]